jgi:hypothetical protein
MAERLECKPMRSERWFVQVNGNVLKEAIA